MTAALMLLASCSDHLTRPGWASALHQEGSIVAPVALVAPDTVTVGDSVAIGAVFAPDHPPCRFLNVVSWTGGNSYTMMWSGRAAPTKICEPPRAMWAPSTTWRSADMPPHLGRALLIACGPDGVAAMRPIIIRLVTRARGDTMPVDPVPMDDLARMEAELVQRSCKPAGGS